MDAKLTKRTDIDFLKRSIPGVFIYAFMWPMLSYGVDFYEQSPLVSHAFSASFIIVSVLRLLHALSTKHVYEKCPDTWRFIMYALAYAHSITLAGLFVVVLAVPEFHYIAMAVALIVVGILSGASASLSPKPVFTQIYIGSLAAPATVACFVIDDYQFLFPLFLATWIYFIFLGRRFYSEYQRAFNIEMSLKENQIKLERLSETDTLTGLFNRQYFDNALDIQWELANRTQKSISILFLDLDHFKNINDEYGHIVGDTVLCHAANLFSEIARRKTDMIARYGGEEFAIILPATEASDALALAEHIRSAVEKTPCRTSEGVIPLTVSIGVNTIIPNHGMNPVDFVDRVDQALYKAKDKGRNQVVHAVNSAS
ncbi:GGDEF domain-containing protein [Bermanella sp. R86510]|uniref:GGDEF domain-containing protein n=1 Tax=unclassified Bermanella TaxID=2627862 RepID=UPI0037C6DCFE